MLANHVFFSAENIFVPKWSSDRNIVAGYNQPANQQECFKLKVKHIIDTERVVGGVIMVNRYCITFRPAIVHLVEYGSDYSMVAFSDVILSIALFKQLPDLNVIYEDIDVDRGGSDRNARHSHGEIYRGVHSDSKTSTQIPMSNDDTKLSYCLCVRVLSSEACRTKKFVNCNSMKSTAHEFGDKSKHEFWFSISPSAVDILYKFFVHRMPKKYANYEASEIFPDLQVPNVHANPESLSKSEIVSSSSDNPQCQQKVELFWKEKVDKLKFIVTKLGDEQENILEKMRQLTNRENSYDDEIKNGLKTQLMSNILMLGETFVTCKEAKAEGVEQVAKHKNCSKNRCTVVNLLDNDQVQENKGKRDLMTKRKNKKISKVNDGFVKAEDVEGFCGQKSVDNILEFIEGCENNAKKEKNNSTKKQGSKKCGDNKAVEKKFVKSLKKTENNNEFSVDGCESFSGEISKNAAVENSDQPEDEECSADFIPVLRNRLLKRNSVTYSSVKEMKPAIKPENNIKIPIVSSSVTSSENEKPKSEKRKTKCKINPYSWPFILLKPENRKIDESEAGKVVTRQKVNVANSSNFSLVEISNTKKHINEESSSSNVN